MPWNQYSPLTWEQYRAIVGDGPLANTGSYVALVSAAQQQNRDPRAMLTELKYENDFGRNISQSQLANNNFAGIKYANQTGATPGGTSPEGDQYARFDSIGSFMSALGKSLGWYISAFPSRNTYYTQLVNTYGGGGVSVPGVVAGGGDLKGGGPLGGGSGPLGLPGVGDIAGGVGDAVSSAIGGLTGKAGSIVKALLSSDLIERGALILVGLILVIVGVSGLTHAPEQAGKVAGAAAMAA